MQVAKVTDLCYQGREELASGLPAAIAINAESISSTWQGSRPAALGAAALLHPSVQLPACADVVAGGEMLTPGSSAAGLPQHR